MIYYPIAMHNQSAFKDYNFNLKDLDVSTGLVNRVLSIPMHPYLKDKDIEHICDVLLRIK